MRKLFAALGLLLVMGTSSAHDYAAGQVWTYHANPGDKGSTLQINKIEQDPKLGAIFHISVFGLRISNPRVAGGVLTELPHLPHWKQEFDAGHAGIYTVSVAEIVTIAEQTMSKAAK